MGLWQPIASLHFFTGMVTSIIERRRALADGVVGVGEAWLTELSTAELKELFTLEKSVF